MAGIGLSGYNGDNILATNARLAIPVGLDVDANGNIYFSDQLNHRIRRVDKTTQVITTVAGTGATVFNGDGVGVVTNFNYPAGISFAASGLLIADSANHRVRVLDAQGNVRTIAGIGSMGWAGDNGAATAAKLSNPSHAVADGRGNVYIADKGNCRVRRIDANGTITTFAGIADPATPLPCGRAGDNGLATLAKLNAPAVLALDPAERYLYILDSSALVVRRVDLATNVISHVAGTGFPGSSGDGGPANVAQLGQPSGLAFNGAGELFIADSNLRRVRKINLQGYIDTVAGGGTGDGLPSEVTRTSPKGVAMDAQGALLIADANGNQHRRIDASNIARTIAGTGDFGFAGDGGLAINADLAYPASVAVDLASRVCFSDQFNQRVRCIYPSGVITTVAGTGQAMYNGDGSATAASLNYPSGIAIDSDNSLLIADSSNHRIRRVKDGAISTAAGTGTFWFNGDGLGPLETNLNNPTAVVVDAARNMYIAEKSSCRIRKYDAASNTMLTIAGTGTCGSTGDGGQATVAKINGPENLVLRSDGILYFTESFAPRVRQVDLNTGVISRVAGTGVAGYAGDGGSATLAQLMRPAGLLLDPSGAYIYIADFDAGNVRRVALDGGGAAQQPTPTPTGTPTPIPPTPTLVPTNTPPPPTSTFTRTSTATLVPTNTATSTLPPTNTATPPNTATPTATKTDTFTRTPTVTPTSTRTNTSTRTPLIASTPTNTLPPTATPTPEPDTPTPTDTDTPLPTKTAANTPTNVPNATSTATLPPTLTRTPTDVPAATFTRTPLAASTATLTRTSTRVPTVTKTRTFTATRTATRTITQTRTRTATATTTRTRTVTTTRTPTVTRTSTKPPTATVTRTPTRTVTVKATATSTGVAPSATPTSGELVASPTGPAGTATRTRTFTATATRTRTATLTRTPTRTVTQTRTRTATVTRTSTKPPTATITRTPTRTLSPTRTFTGTQIVNTPTETPTPVPTNTPVPTATPTEDPLRSSSNIGPVVTYVGIASSAGTVIGQAGTENSVPIFTRTSGHGFYIVVEAKKGSGLVNIGRQVQRGGTAMADFQVEISRDVGNGSATYCDTATGGSQAISPLDFVPSPFVINATSDFTCGFTSTVSSSAAVTVNASSVKSFVKGDSTVQFYYLLPSTRAFALGDTLFTVRVLDVDGNPGPIEQMILRIG